MASIRQTFAAGTSGATISPGDTQVAGDTAFDTITFGATGAGVYETKAGRKALKLSTGATSSAITMSWNTSSFPGTSSVYGRTYVYLTGAPAALLRIYDNNTLGAVGIQTSGKVFTQAPTGSTRTQTVNAIPYNQWVRIEWHLTYSASNATTDLRVYYTNPDGATADETPTPQSGIAGTAGPSTTTRSGSISGGANIAPFWIADVKVNNTGFPGASETVVSQTGAVANFAINALGPIGSAVSQTGPVSTITTGAPAGSSSSVTVTAPVSQAGPVSDFTLTAYPGTLNLPIPFRTPSIKLRPEDPKGERLWIYYGIDRGISVMKLADGTYIQGMNFTPEQISAALKYWGGGREYIVTADEWAELNANGYFYGIYIAPGTTPPPDPGGGGGSTDDPDTYGGGAYGSGKYGF